MAMEAVEVTSVSTLGGLTVGAVLDSSMVELVTIPDEELDLVSVGSMTSGWSAGEVESVCVFGLVIIVVSSDGPLDADVVAVVL